MTSPPGLPFPSTAFGDLATPWLAPLTEEFDQSAYGSVLAFAEPAETLAQRFDWLLGALPVARHNPSRDLHRAILKIDPAGGLILRRIRLAEGSTVDLVALPSALADDPDRFMSLRTLRRQRHRAGFPLRIIPESVVAREPRLTQARLIADCAEFRPSLRAGRRLILRLLAQGGSAALCDCLAPLRGEADPACAVLALVGAKILTVDLDEPLGPKTRVSLSPLCRPLA